MGSPTGAVAVSGGEKSWWQRTISGAAMRRAASSAASAGPSASLVPCGYNTLKT